jgi:hypothetical protein
VNAVALVASQILALGLGAALVARLVRRGPGALAVYGGYGYVLGSIGITLILRALSVAGVKWNFALPAWIAAALATAIIASGRWRRPTPATPAAIRTESATGALFWLLFVLVAIHGGLALSEAWMRPLFPWDATTNWSSKARAWFEMRTMVPFVDDMTWVRSFDAVFTDAHPTYPAAIPLIQVWAALGWGTWDDAIINVGWPLTLFALAAGIYGQLRRLDVTPTVAMAGAFAVISLPFVDVHAALAGYADLTMAALYAFAVLSLACWVRGRRRADFVLLLACALAMPMVKTPGWAWLATVAAGVASVFLPRKWLIGLAAGALVGAVIGVAIAVHAGLTVMGYTFRGFSWSAVASLLDNVFSADSWHLLGIAIPVALIIGWRSMLAEAHLPVGLTLAAGAVFLAAVFLFSNTSQEGVITALTVNRALLHWVPALVAYLVWILDDALTRQFSSSPPAMTVAGATAPAQPR